MAFFPLVAWLFNCRFCGTAGDMLASVVTTMAFRKPPGVLGPSLIINGMEPSDVGDILEKVTVWLLLF